MKRSYICFFSLLFILFQNHYAQTTKEEVVSDYRFAGGLYCPYIIPKSEQTPAPKGYSPFYISHYGRHGSRWVISPDCHTVPLKALKPAADTDKLTERGIQLYKQLLLAAEDAKDRYSDLSPLGIKEQKQIAKRMYNNFPEIFTGSEHNPKRIFSRATQVPRCILSMAAFDESLKECNQDLEITIEATKRNTYLNNEAVLNRDTVKAIVDGFLKKHLSTERFITALFSDKESADKYVPDPINFMTQVFSAAINIPNLDHLQFGFINVFTADEIFVLWQSYNMHMYYLVGPSTVNGTNALGSAKLLLRNIIENADSAAKHHNKAADFRFGHDTYIIPLLALMDITNMNVPEKSADSVFAVWSNFKASPMGANVQLVFFNKENSDDYLVKVLLNEKEVQIPVKSDILPYYHWADVKEYYNKKLSLN